MPTGLQDAETGAQNLVFSGDLDGVIFRMTEAAVYDAAEVRAELHDDPAEDDADALDRGQPPAFGRWVPAAIEGDDAYVNAPGELIEELQDMDAEKGQVFRVTKAEKSGDGETDAIEVNLKRESNDTQTRL